MSRFKKLIAEKKNALEKLAAKPLLRMAEACAPVWNDADQLDAILQQGMHELWLCSLIYAVDTNGTLISSNVESNGLDTQWRGMILTERPYFRNRLPSQGLAISNVYTSRHTLQPTLTVMQAVRNEQEILGFIAADFNVDTLPATTMASMPASNWQQYKGDPAIRGTLFLQERAISAMDKVLDQAMEIITDLMQHHGIFHCKIHFSSSRVSFWSVNDPFDYQIHEVDEITGPDVCLAYPHQPLHERANITEQDIARVLRMLKKLRHADETIYLRSASFNLINGMVGLTFSCDGSHYLHYTEFLDKDMGLWFGDSGAESGYTDLAS